MNVFNAHLKGVCNKMTDARARNLSLHVLARGRGRVGVRPQRQFLRWNAALLEVMKLVGLPGSGAPRAGFFDGGAIGNAATNDLALVLP